MGRSSNKEVAATGQGQGQVPRGSPGRDYICLCLCLVMACVSSFHEQSRQWGKKTAYDIMEYCISRMWVDCKRKLLFSAAFQHLSQYIFCQKITTGLNKPEQFGGDRD